MIPNRFACIHATGYPAYGLGPTAYQAAANASSRLGSRSHRRERVPPYARIIEAAPGYHWVWDGNGCKCCAIGAP